MLKRTLTNTLDLRSYLSEVEDSVLRVTAPTSTVHEVTAIQQALQERQQFPIVRIERPVLVSGKESTLPVICNLTASRELTANALGVPDHKLFARAYSAAVGASIAPRIVDLAVAPVQEVVIQKSDVDLTKLPALTQHVGDPGPYLTAAHATTFDPDSMVDNTAIQRCWIKEKAMMTYYPYPTSHNAMNLRKFWARGEHCPVAFWIGHHPLVLVGCQAKLTYPGSHWAAAGGVLGEPLRVVPSITHGDKIMVPADAEIVIEGWAPKDVLTADGPFGEYAGYMGAQTISPICEVTCITRRKDAIYHDYGSGLVDMLVPDNMVHEAKLFDLVKQVAPSLANVHVPTSGRRFHAYFQFNNPAAGEVRDALAAALSYRRTKMAIAVDGDIDLFDDSEIMWALATRVQWDRDVIELTGMSGSPSDPSWPKGAETISKAGIDATMPPKLSDGPPLIAPQSRVTDEVLGKARRLIEAHFGENWPRQ